MLHYPPVSNTLLSLFAEIISSDMGTYISGHLCCCTVLVHLTYTYGRRGPAVYHDVSL